MMGRYDTPSLNQTTLKIIALYRSNYWRVLHSREIARSIAKDIQTVSVQLRQLEEAGILTSAQPGRQKDYRLVLQNVATKYYLILAETYTTLAFLNEYFIIKKVLQELQRGTDIPFLGSLVLFGSFAAEQADEESDVDILALTERPSDELAFGDFETVTGREINIKSMTDSQFLAGLRHESPLVREVISCHVVLQDIDRFCNLMWAFFGIWK
jgi:predicted nucleotidyltransferase